MGMTALAKWSFHQPNCKPCPSRLLLVGFRGSLPQFCHCCHGPSHQAYSGSTSVGWLSYVSCISCVCVMGHPSVPSASRTTTTQTCTDLGIWLMGPCCCRCPVGGLYTTPLAFDALVTTQTWLHCVSCS
ncbi:hypothetical protein BCR44DRAFT_81402 [Catenaria anguillulae PL171]|uniref:Uncharacterized protein n=1 Tax=Catenaria anguillulae PL171 TaxID=765915 RepID=A0A1Y2HGS4_9FUNG|nr:hypothetical protein BCR44DRAFT_81402 [Catenaria anguillulae PL171]